MEFSKKEGREIKRFLGLLKKKKVVKLKQNVFQEVKKFKIQRCCKGCGKRIVVENANRYYCTDCRGY